MSSHEEIREGHKMEKGGYGQSTMERMNKQTSDPAVFGLTLTPGQQGSSRRTTCCRHLLCMFHVLNSSGSHTAVHHTLFQPSCHGNGSYHGYSRHDHCSRVDRASRGHREWWSLSVRVSNVWSQTHCKHTHVGMSKFRIATRN